MTTPQDAHAGQDRPGSSGRQAAWTGRRRPGAALACVASGAAASALMQTLLASATPRIVAELAGPGLYGLVAGSYLVSSVLALPVCAQYADRLGPRRVVAAGHVCFCAGTLGLALAPTMPLLVAARAVQGLGAGAIAPAGLAALGLLLSGPGRGRALSWVAVVQVVANLVGPPLGGWLTDGPGWRLGAAAAAPVSLLSLLLTWSLPAAGTVPGQGWWRFSPREQLRVWTGGALGRCVVLCALAGALTLGSLTYAPLALHSLHGMDATATGWLLAPMLACAGAGAAASGRLAPRGWVRPACWLLMLVGLLAVAGPSLVVAVLGLAAAGLGAGAVLPLLLLDAQGSVTQEQLAQASGAVQLGRSAGAAAGVLGLGLWLGAGPPARAVLPGIFATMSALAGLGAVLSPRRERA